MKTRTAILYSSLLFTLVGSPKSAFSYHVPEKSLDLVQPEEGFAVEIVERSRITSPLGQVVGGKPSSDSVNPGVVDNGGRFVVVLNVHIHDICRLPSHIGPDFCLVCLADVFVIGVEFGRLGRHEPFDFSLGCVDFIWGFDNHHIFLRVGVFGPCLA